MVEHRVQIASAKGRWSVECNGTVIGEFADPEAAAARYLLDNGFASPADTLSTYRGDMQCLTGNVGRLAGVASPVRPTSEKKLAGLIAARAALAARRAAARASLASVKSYREAQDGSGGGDVAQTAVSAVLTEGV
jgi:hypothetical protein